MVLLKGGKKKKRKRLELSHILCCIPVHAIAFDVLIFCMVIHNIYIISVLLCISLPWPWVCQHLLHYLLLLYICDTSVHIFPPCYGMFNVTSVYFFFFFSWYLYHVTWTCARSLCSKFMKWPVDDAFTT